MFIGAMSDAVEEAILTKVTSDPVLAVLIDITLASIQENRPLFPNLMDEPILYRHFKEAVSRGLENLKKIEAMTGEG